MPHINQHKLAHNNIELLCQSVINCSHQIDIPAHTTIFRQGDSCNKYLLVTEGVVKVFTRAENGREILLYRVHQGESCTLSTTCLLAENSYPAEGVTETAVSALVISVADFNRQLGESSEFRQFVFNTYGQRLRDVIAVIESVSFDRMESRIAKWLTCAFSSKDAVNITHQTLAMELGTAREVISRQLKEFERHGVIKLNRGKIELVDRDALQKIASFSLG